MSFSIRQMSAQTVVVGALCVLCVSAAASSVLQGAVSDSENVCISVTVIGPGGGDPGTGCGLVAGSSSVSSASSSSNTSSVSGDVNPSGGYRYTQTRSHWKIVRLLRQWTRSNTLSPASASVSHTSSSSSSLWYEDAVRELQGKGYIDDTGDLRLDAPATRAETAKLIMLYSGSQSPVPDVLSFDDAITGAWYVPFIERAAQQAWMIGYGNCYGTRPCIFRPAAVITRAEAAATFVRVFDLYPSYTAPKFLDVQYRSWYRDVMRSAADVCIVQGKSGLSRPDDHVTRAELIVMFYRAMHHLQYGPDCTSTVDEVIQPAVSTPPSDIPTEEPVCSASIPMCLFDALHADLGSIVRPLVASLLSVDLRAVRAVPASEWLVWMTVAALPIGALALLHRIRNNRTK